MRLICGFVRLDGAPADSSILKAMTAALGTPGLAPVVSSKVDGAAALAVLEFANHAVPAASSTLPVGRDGVWLAGDVRLDRPRELATTLGLPGGTSTGQLVLAGVSRWDVNLPDRMDGDFALAAWDPARRRLLCARDIMGVRPLCYAWEAGSWFAFASLPRGLHGSGVISARPNLNALGRILIDVLPVDAATPYEGISWLPAGHSLAVQEGHVRLERVWRPDESAVGCWHGRPEDAAQELRTLIEEAVACRLPESGPVAAHLSGGLDSSAISVIAARQLRVTGRKLLAFSQLSGENAEGLLDERSYVKTVLAQEPDIEWRSVHIPRFGRSLEAVDIDLPGTLAVFALTRQTSAGAAAGGAHMLLSGAGGDEAATYNATGLYAALLRQGYWRGLPRAIHKLASRTGRGMGRVVMERFVAPLAPDWVHTLTRRLRGRPVTYRRSLELSLLAPELAKEVAASRQPPAFNSRSTPVERIRVLTHGYLAARAASWAIQGAQDGVALSYPLVDRRVVNFVLSLRLDQLAGEGFTRQPFRNAMAGILPEEIRWRDTKFMSAPDAPIAYAAAKRELLEQLTEVRANPAAHAFANLDAVEQAIRSVPEGDAAQQLASKLNRDTGEWAKARRAIAALRALQMAQHVARLGS